MDSLEIRRKFIKFFKDREHKIVPSDSLVPSGDPTLLFTSAGMVQFKKHFLGQSKDTFTRAASCQKCFRTSDIEQVGKTRRHLTFFEMLGNFSFGDYFKQEAIAWAWEFLTKEIGLPADKLYPTVYKDDNEAFDMWKKIVPESRISRLGEDSNFWNMGPTGPCGPCSEILMDMGEHLGCNKPDCRPGCDCDRYLEVWNLVFTQFDRQENGELKNLPRKNIDTGMGFERLVIAANYKESVFDTDLFEPIIKSISQILNINVKDHVSDLRMMADHVRAVTFLISDGILPSNEGRGYVLRRILRRALRKGKMLGAGGPFLYRVTAQITEFMKEAYPELDQRRENIAAITKMEEENFLETLESGMKMLQELIDKYRSSDVVANKGVGKTKFMIPGDEAFKLYDTYGFPFDLTKEIAHEQGLDIDEEGFTAAQKQAQEKSRAAWSGSGEKDMTFYSKLQKEVGDSKFGGYEKTADNAKIMALIKNNAKVDKLETGEEGEVILSETPFYAESGGQIGDKGQLRNENTLVEVIDTIKPIDGLIVHKVKVIKGGISSRQHIEAAVDIERRKKIMGHHTATHLLHKALRQVLGKHVTQAGSLVTDEYFRFDFAHFNALKFDEIQAVEDIVNKAVRDNMEVNTEKMKLEDARKEGAMALFGEKYSQEVRVIKIEKRGLSPFSMELCGGTHAARTGDIGLFKIISESSIASGTRRIEAVTGEAAEKYVRRLQQTINDAAYKLKGSLSDLPERIDKVLKEQKEMEKEIKRLKSSLATGGGSNSILNEVKKINGINVLLNKVADMDVKSLREVSDKMRDKIGSGIVILASNDNKKLSFIVNVTKDLVDSGYNAGKIAKNIAAIVEGSGGGKPDFAQGGGKKAELLDTAFEKIAELIK